MTSPRIGHRWATVAIVGYTGPVSAARARVLRDLAALPAAPPRP
jgi:predicted amino acid dehydrogenase